MSDVILSHVEAAQLRDWWCELCERTHKIGEHDPGKSWPVLTERPPPRPRTASSRDLYTCPDCGVNMFDCSPAALAKHAACVEMFGEIVQRLTGEAQATLMHFELCEHPECASAAVRSPASR